MKRAFLVTAAVALLLTTVLAACSKGNNEKSSTSSTTPAASTSAPESSGASSEASPEQNVFELGSEPLNLTFYAHYDWYTMRPWGEDVVSKWIQDTKKVTITPISSGGASKQKLNTMLSTKEFADLMWFDRGAAEYEMMRKNGLLVPFDDYLDKYPNMKKWVPEQTLNMLRAEDGKLYQFPNWYTDGAIGTSGWVINKKIYTELGEPKLETTEDLYNYAKLVKEKYPDVVPIESDLAIDGNLLDLLYSSFEENAKNKWVGIRARPVGDKMESIFNDPTYRESMKFAAKLYREKLMTQDAFTQTRDQVREKIMNGKVAVYASINATDFTSPAHEALQAADPNAGYFFIMPIAKPGLDRNKIYTGTFATLGWNVVTIARTNNDPEKAFAYLDWLTGPEGQTVLSFGPPGPNGFWDGFKEVDGIPTPIVNAEAYVSRAKELAEIRTIADSFTWNGNTKYIDTVKAEFEATLPEGNRSWQMEQMRNVTWKTQLDATELNGVEPSKETPEGIAMTSVEDIWDKSRAAALMSSKSDADVDKILDKANSDAMKVGYQSVLDYKTKKWQENLVMLGKK